MYFLGVFRAFFWHSGATSVTVGAMTVSISLHPSMLRPLGSTALGALFCVGCAAQSAAPLEWAPQPSPSYPTPGKTAEESPAPAEPEPISEEAPAPVSTSSLAKQYEGAKALETLRGKATYYADSLSGNHTANGDIYDPEKLTAAHKKLAFGTVVRVIRLDGEQQRTTYVRINDRGPFGAAERIIDLSKAAARELDMLRAGVVAVRVEIVQLPE